MSMPADEAGTETVRDDGFFDMRAVITLILLVTSACMLVGFSVKILQAPENDIIKGALGSWFTLTALATQFYFGSNSQSKLKDGTVNSQAQALAAQAAKDR